MSDRLSRSISCVEFHKRILSMKLICKLMVTLRTDEGKKVENRKSRETHEEFR